MKNASLVSRRVFIASILTTVTVMVPAAESLTNAPVKAEANCPACKDTRKCPQCHGSGQTKCQSCNGDGKTRHNCSSCSGRGRTTSTRRTGGKTRTSTSTCSSCGGKGYKENSCSSCSGKGKKTCSKCNGSKVCQTCKGK